MAPAISGGGRGFDAEDAEVGGEVFGMSFFASAAGTLAAVVTTFES